MIDGATSDEDKVTPVYKLEEICELLRGSHASIVKEVSEFVLKRLDHKSPIVKQKALRVIKYSVGKSGAEFRRQMQRHSVAVRQLVHYRGQPDPLKGDALNKSVRETAQEALSAIFSTDDGKPSPAENVTRRIEGFGNTNYAPHYEDKKSFLSEVVDIGSASIKQGISNLTQGQIPRSNDTGNYKGPTLRRSLTNEMDYTEKYDRTEYRGGNLGASGSSKNLNAGTWGQESRMNREETSNGDSSSSYTDRKTREERLLETIVTSGGVRLQPTRDALQSFLLEASKLDALALCHALESKLQAPMWQVRMKAICVLEAILRKTDDEHFSAIASYFSENIDIVVRCSESPQASVREKATKVLNLLGGGQSGITIPSKSEPMQKVEMPDLIDTGDQDDLLTLDDSSKGQEEQSVANQPISSAPLIDDLFNDNLSTAAAETSMQKSDDDPFADVSFHSGEDKGDDLFAGMTVGDDSGSNGVHHVAKSTTSSVPFDIFGSNSDLSFDQQSQSNGVDNLMAGLSISSNGSSMNLGGAFPSELLDTHSSDKAQSRVSVNSVNAGVNYSQIASAAAHVHPAGPPMPFNMAPGMMFNQGYPSQPINYGAMGGFLSQQQLFAAMANLQHMNNLNSQSAAAAFGSEGPNGGPSALPDIFNGSIPNQGSAVTMNNTKKEDTKAFDFISDHLAAARDSKRVI